MRRKVFAGTAAALAAVVIAAIAIGSRDNKSPTQQRPLQAKPSLQFGDDADLMRRLERKKLTTRTTR